MPDDVFSPGRIGSLGLRNRFLRAAAFEGMAHDGLPTDSLLEYHRRLARGGVGLSTVAYAAVCPSARSYSHQLCLWRPGVASALRRLTDAVHREGAAASLQLAHAGHAANPEAAGGRAIAPSRVLNRYTRSWPRAMDERDIEEVVEAFASGARSAVEAGFDAVEIHAGHGYLLSQFLSPYTNRRRDRFGGALENRLRFPLAVLRRLRARVGAKFPIVIKMNLSDGFRGGLEIEEAVEIAQRFEAEGADALQLSGGFMTRAPIYVMRGEVPHAELRRGLHGPVARLGALVVGRLLVRPVRFREAYFLEQARRVRAAVALPLALVGGMRRLATMRAAVGEGFDFVALARPLIAEPDLVARFERGEASGSRCRPCNRCLAAVARGEVSCPLLAEAR